jgi:hypothetical protein
MSAVSKTIVARHRLLRGVGMVAVVVPVMAASTSVITIWGHAIEGAG